MFRGAAGLLVALQKISISCEQRGLTKKNLAECVEDKGSKKIQVSNRRSRRVNVAVLVAQYTSTNLSAFILYFV